MKDKLEEIIDFKKIIDDSIRKNINDSLPEIVEALDIPTFSIAYLLVNDREDNKGFNRIDTSRLSGMLKYKWFDALGLEIDIKICDKVATDIIIDITKYDEEHK